MKQELNTGNYLNLENTTHKLGNDQLIICDIYKLKVEGGYIYYRDLCFWENDKMKKICQSAIFVKDS